MCSFNKARYDLFLEYLQDHYNASDLVDKLQLTTNDLLIYLDEYIMDNLHKLSDDLNRIGICPTGEYDDYD